MTTSTNTWKLYPATEAGHTDIGWLKSLHTFSFAEFLDPDRMGYRSLRVVNDDLVAGGEGFGMHGHRDMEILSFVAEGALEHKDSMGNGSIIRPGEIQFMGAGSGVRHSEFNPSKTETVRLIQIWILPSRRGLEPAYEQVTYGKVEPGTPLLLASADAVPGTVRIRQDAKLFVADAKEGTPIRHTVAAGRGLFVHVVTGKVAVDGQELGQSDGAAFDAAAETEITIVGTGRVLLFDMA